ncbi:MAG: chloride channel protein [Anaerolineae bacterium]|nr:chloride channel protein [Anaerolineae bacterium]
MSVSHAESRQRLHSAGQRLRQMMAQWLDQFNIPESAVIISTALVVGIGSGLGAVLFHLLIDGTRALTYEGLEGVLRGIAPFHLMLIPALGGLIVGVLIYGFAREAQGHGVPEIMESVALQGGRIRPRVAVVKTLASAVCIGTGGSVGPEGPIAQIGAAIGSAVGQVFDFSDERVRNLVACGAAGGIAAIFNAPIAGALFAIEVILGRLNTVYFGAVVISAVTADVIARALQGNAPVYRVPAYALASPWELGFYALLGAVVALASVAFSRLLYVSEDVWGKIPLPAYVKPALGGILLGVVGILTFKIDGFPRIFGIGDESITQALFGELTLQFALALLFLKVLATTITLGSGGSGGVFAPLLFMGAMLGASFGHVVHGWFPVLTAPAGAYALVGMAAFLSGAAHAPLTSILIVFEITNDYHIILPLMLATVMATFVSRMLSRESIYTLKLSRRGIHLQQGQDIDVMQGVSVGQVMTTDFKTVDTEMPLEELSEMFASTHSHGFPVVDRNGDLAGIISIQDLERAIAAGRLAGRTVADVATTQNVLITYPDESMWQALRKLGTRDVGRLPVVERKNPKQLVGVIRRSDIVRAYNSAIVQRAHHQHRAEILRLRKLDGTNFAYVDIPEGAPVIGQRVSQVRLPEACLIMSVRRGRKLHIAHGQTTIQAGDLVTVFGEQECLGEVQKALTGEGGE